MILFVSSAPPVLRRNSSTFRIMTGTVVLCSSLLINSMFVLSLSLILILVITSDSLSRLSLVTMLLFFVRLTPSILIVQRCPLLFSMLISWFSVLAVILRLFRSNSVPTFIIILVSFYLNLELLSFILRSV